MTQPLARRQDTAMQHNNRHPLILLSSYEIAINSIEFKKLDRLKDLKELYNNIVRYYPETLFEEDLIKKMKTIDKEINTFER